MADIISTGESPLISIIIPVYNGERYIIRALKSAAVQTYSPFEICVINDGSTDRTGELIDGFITAHPDLPIRYLEQKNQGVSSARNTAIRNSRGLYLSLLDADDIIYPDCLEILESYRRRYPEAGCIMGGANCIEYDEERKVVDQYSLARPDLEYIEPDDAHRRLFFQTVLGVNSIIIKRSVYDRVGGFAEEFISGEDLDFWFRMAYCYSFLIVPETLGMIYKYPHSLSQQPGHLFRFMKKTFLRERETLLKNYPAEGPEIFRRAMVIAHLVAGGYYRKKLPVALLPFLRHLFSLLWLRPAVVFNSEVRRKILYERNPPETYILDQMGEKSKLTRK